LYAAPLIVVSTRAGIGGYRLSATEAAHVSGSSSRAAGFGYSMEARPVMEMTAAVGP
jgi:hypothetical protein